MASLAGEIIAITGAASGISLATAKTLSARRASIFLADVHKDALDAAVSEIKSTIKALPSSTHSAPSILT